MVVTITALEEQVLEQTIAEDWVALMAAITWEETEATVALPR